MPDHDLKTLKVTDLKAILSKAGLSAPPRKNEMIAKIEADSNALAVWKELYPSPDAPQPPPPVAAAPSPHPEDPKPEPSIAVPPTTATAAPVDEAEKRRLRAERFGIPLVEPPKLRAAAPQKRSPFDDPAKIATRAARFGATQKRPAPAESVDPEEEERRRKRAERFGTKSTVSITHLRALLALTIRPQTAA
ncbi:hypothetical protein H0H87_007079 [Tephrocybe sp. NHM501043]|nr:hypothetical protein H0H87_007079 [Tephrocybe sp. NHM501043]